MAGPLERSSITRQDKTWESHTIFDIFSRGVKNNDVILIWTAPDKLHMSDSRHHVHRAISVVFQIRVQFMYGL